MRLYTVSISVRVVLPLLFPFPYAIMVVTHHHAPSNIGQREVERTRNGETQSIVHFSVSLHHSTIGNASLPLTLPFLSLVLIPRIVVFCTFPISNYKIIILARMRQQRDHCHTL